jgi:hypothetical protein
MMAHMMTTSAARARYACLLQAGAYLYHYRTAQTETLPLSESH